MTDKSYCVCLFCFVSVVKLTLWQIRYMTQAVCADRWHVLKSG